MTTNAPTGQELEALRHLDAEIDRALRDYDALPTEHRDDEVRDDMRTLRFTVRHLLYLRAALAARSVREGEATRDELEPVAAEFAKAREQVGHAERALTNASVALRVGERKLLAVLSRSAPPSEPAPEED